jgi:F-type H+-transporting ATPase subunit gamma
MANTKDLRNQIASIKNTQQTTRAMKMVSAAKLRRAQHAIVNARPYALKLRSVISKIALGKGIEHPYLKTIEKPKSLLLVVMTSDRGLCGSFNSSVLRAAGKFYRESLQQYEKVSVFGVGRRAGDFFRKQGAEPVDVILNLAKDIRYEMAEDLAAKLLKWFEHGEYDEVQVVYNEFKSAISQRVVSETILPVKPEESVGADADFASADILFEPAAAVIIDELLKKNFAIQIYRCMQESIASEHGARMNAMENATKNAGEMIRSLTLNLNKIRQAAITTELMEITSGAEALKG